jgi:transposase
MKSKQPHTKKLNHTEEMRKKVLQHWKNGYTGTQIAEMLLIPQSTVYAWLKSYAEEGPSTLVPKKRGRHVGSG